MEDIILGNPPLSFKPKTLSLVIEDDLKRIIYSDGIKVGWLVTHNGYSVIPNGKLLFTERDKSYLIAQFIEFNNQKHLPWR